MEPAPNQQSSQSAGVEAASVQSASQPSKQPKKAPFLLIGAIVGVIVLLCLVFGGLYVYSGSVAATYTNNERAYLDAYQKKIDNSSSPVDAQTAVSTMHAPTLPNVPLGAINPAYSKAHDHQTAATKIMSDVSTKLNDYANVHKFYEDYDQQLDKAKVLGSVEPTNTDELATWAGSLLVLLGNTKKITNDFQPPHELASAKSDLAKAINDELTYTQAIKHDAEAKDEDSYLNDYSHFRKASLDESAALTKITNYMSAHGESDVMQDISDARKLFN